MRPAGDIGFEINTLSHFLKRRVDESLSQSGAEGVTGMQGRILGYLFDRREQELFQRDVERQFHIRRSTATGILQLMERDGLLTREPVAYDARLKRLCLTEKAVRLHEIVCREIMEVESRLRGCLTEEETQTLLRILAKLRQSLE